MEGRWEERYVHMCSPSLLPSTNIRIFTPSGKEFIRRSAQKTSLIRDSDTTSCCSRQRDVPLIFLGRRTLVDRVPALFLLLSPSKRALAPIALSVLTPPHSSYPDFPFSFRRALITVNSYPSYLDHSRMRSEFENIPRALLEAYVIQRLVSISVSISPRFPRFITPPHRPHPFIPSHTPVSPRLHATPRHAYFTSRSYRSLFYYYLRIHTSCVSQ